MKLLLLGAEFMAPYWRPEVSELVQMPLARFDAADHDEIAREIGRHRDAVFAYAMNTPGPAAGARLRALAEMCRRAAIPTVWHTIEDPNSFATFVGQAEGFDVIATSDAELLGAYRAAHPRAVVRWLPLAAQPMLHQPAPLGEDAADFVLIANWYEGDARLEGVARVVEPIVDAGRTLALYSYARCRWPEKYWRWWRGETSCYDVAAYYPSGRIALGLNNQTYGTAMTSMRTFEALACGKPLIAAASDAYQQLGFSWGQHFFWSASPGETLELVREIDADPEASAAMAERGRAFVLAEHTYAHRLTAILTALS